MGKAHSSGRSAIREGTWELVESPVHTSRRLLVDCSEITLSSLLPLNAGAFENVNEQVIRSVIRFKM